MALNGAPKSVGKRPSNKQKGEIESTVDLSVENDRSTPNFNFQSLGHYPAASQVPHPTYGEAVQTDGIAANGYFSQQSSAGSQYPMFRYIITLQNSKCPIISI